MKLIPNWLRHRFEQSLAPIAHGLIVARVHPNTLTTVGFVILAASAAAFGTGYVRVGGTLLLLSGVLDMLDGKVARVGGTMSRFGAFYDSTLDRIGSRRSLPASPSSSSGAASRPNGSSSRC